MWYFYPKIEPYLISTTVDLPEVLKVQGGIFPLITPQAISSNSNGRSD